MLRGGGWLFFSQLIVFMSIPFLSRLYSPSDYADYSIFFAFFVICSSICSLRLTDAIVVELEKNLNDLIFSIVIIAFSISFIFSLIFVYFRNDVGWFYIYISLNSQVFIQIASFMDVRRKRYGRASMWLALSSISTAGMQILASNLSPQSGLIYGHVLGVSLVAALACFSNFKLFKYRGLIILKYTILRNESFVKYLTLYSLIGGIRSKIIYLLLAGNPLLGVLNQAERLINAPSILLSGAIRPVIYNSFSKKTIKDNGENVIGGIACLLYALSLPLIIFSQDYSREIVYLILGYEWQEYHQLFWFVGIASIGILLTNWMDRIFDITRKQRVSFFVEIFMIVVYAVAIYISHHIFGPLFAVYSLLILNLMSSLVWLSVVYYICDFSFKSYFKRVMFFLVYGVLVLFSYCLLKNTFQPIIYIIGYASIYSFSVYFVFKITSINKWLKKKL